MRRKARIVTQISRGNNGNRRVSIPRGSCEIDDGPHGTGPYIVSWNEGAQIVSSELTLTELVSYVDVETEPWMNPSGRRHRLRYRYPESGRRDCTSRGLSETQLKHSNH